MSKKKIYAICISIIVGFLVVSSLVFFGVDHLITKNKIHSTLKDNFSELTTDYGFGADIIENKYSVFLAGETNGTAKNADAEIALIKLLHEEEFGVNNILFELPHSMCIRLNEYLQTGDEEILDEVLQSIPEDNPARNDRFKKFFADLKDFNDSLKNKKLKLFGLSAEFSNTSAKRAVKMLQNIVANASEPLQFLSVSWQGLNELDTENNYSNERLSEVFDALLSTADENRGSLEAALGNDYNDYLCMVQSVAAMVSGKASAKNGAAFEENTMHEIFQTVYANAGKKPKFFGQFCNTHTLLVSKTAGVDPLAKQINESESLRNKVCSIRYSYKDSVCLDFATGKQHNVSQTMYEKEFNRYVTVDGLTLLRLDAPNSIFTQQQMIINGIGKCTAACFQYVLLIDGSPASKKI